MIRKLRWKFVAVCMGLVALVLSAVFGAAYHAVRQNIEDLSRQMLYQVLREDSGRGAVPNPTIEIGGDRVLLPYFTVNIWGDTAYITGGTYADLENTDTLRDILSQCLEQEAAEGTVNEYHLRYLSMDNGLYRKLAFVDMSMEQAVLRRLVRSYLLIALGAMLVLLGIAAAASRWVTRPVEKAWKQQRQFLSDASHELKTPLTSILGTAEILQNGLVKPEDVPHFAGNIHRETERLIGLVNDIIKLSRLDEGGGLGQWETVDLYEEARAVLEQLAPAAQRKQVTTRLQGGEALVRGVPQIVEEIVYNLCDNAIAYNRANGSVTVTVENTAFGPRITVADTGIGIPREAQGRVFERFYRVDKSHSSGGTGLGLSIVKHGAAYLGAQVELHSEPGHGSTFTLTFPKAGA